MDKKEIYTSASGLKVHTDRFHSCNLKLLKYTFREKAPEKNNGWVRLELDITAAEGNEIPEDVIISLSYIVEWDDEYGDFSDPWNPDPDLAEDGSGISYPLHYVIHRDTFSGSVTVVIPCPDRIMRAPSSYELTAEKRSSYIVMI